MNNLFLTLFGICLSVTVGSCSRGPDTSITSLEVSISPTITRVSGVNFDQGDEIGLTITRTSGVHANNVRMRYDGSHFLSSALTWYVGDDASTLVAYYPYAESGPPTLFCVASDQSLGYASSDLLGALRSNVNPTSSPVSMVFRHLMSALKITVTNNTSSPVASITIGGTITEADVNLAMQSVAVNASTPTTAIKAYAVAVNTLYQAIVVPQVAAMVVTVTTADGKSRSANFESSTLLSGKLYTISLIVEAESLIPTLSGEVADWETGGSLKPDTGGGDSGGEAGQSMLCQGVSYRTVTHGSLVWMAENLRHIPSDITSRTDVKYPDANKGVDLTKYGMLYTYAAAQSFCPVGWRLPTELDFEALFALLTEPYDAFIPLSGSYVEGLGEYKYFSLQGYLICSSIGDIPDSHKCCILQSSKPPKLLPGYADANAISVRYVKGL